MTRRAILVTLLMLFAAALFVGASFADELTETPPAPEATEVLITDPASIDPTPEMQPTAEATEAQPLPVDSTPAQPPETALPVTEEVPTEPVPAEQTPEPLPVLPPDTERGMGDAGLLGTQTFCQLSIDDLGDSNPFTYQFAAVNTSNIVSYAWTIDGASVSTAQSFSHTFGSTGTFTIELTCVPTSGSNLVLTGSISVFSMPVANFSVSPATTGFAPFAVTLTNTSTGEGLSYLWEVIDMPGGAGPFAPLTSEHAAYSFTVPGIYRVRLTVTDAIGTGSVVQQDIAVNAPPPQADFTLTPASGAAVLNVTVEGVDEGMGPIDTWSWDFDYTSGAPDVDATGQGPHYPSYVVEGIYSIRMDYSGPGGSGYVIKQVGVFPAAGALTAEFTVESRTPSGGNVEVCFRNISTGPIAHNYWDFDVNDANPPVENNAEIVCYVYPANQTFRVRLRVENAAGDASAEREQDVTVIGSPVAGFTASTYTLTWGGTIDFTNTSSGIIDTYSWDFNGDGVEDSSAENPGGIAIGNIGGVMQLGPNPVRLTVTGPGGTSYVEAIIVVERLALSCDFSGSTFVTPGSGAQTYSELVDEGGRTVSYQWTVTGISPDPSGPSFSTTWSAPGSYTVTLNATSLTDGASCSETKVVTVSYPPLVCNLSGSAAVLPNGSSYTYDANVTPASLAGRTISDYSWYVDGNPVAAQTGLSDLFSYSWNTHGTTTAIRYVATASDGSSCDESITVTAEWSPLTCSITGGSDTPRPGMPNDPGGMLNYTYNASVGGDNSRSLTYAWTIRDGGGAIVSSGSGTSISFGWDWTQVGDNYTVDLNVSTNEGGYAANCNATTRNLTVTLPTLECRAPIGDATPVLNEIVNYARDLRNDFGRPWEFPLGAGTSTDSTFWDFQQADGTGGWIDIASDVAGDTMPYQFLLPGETYRVRYRAFVINPDEDCESGWKTITVAGTGSNFTCDGWGTTVNPTNPAASYTYSVNVDNTNRILLNYHWELVGEGASIDLGSTQWDLDNAVTSPAFSGVQLGPNGLGNYTLRVTVSAVDPFDSTHVCDMSSNLTVGTFAVNYSYTGDANAIEVGQQICLDNLSTNSFASIDGLNYTWDFGTAGNSLGSQTSNAEEPGCLSFNAQGTYVIRLTGSNDSGSRSAFREYTFRVWNTQSVLISRNDSFVYAGNTLSFSASGVNINTYTWNFYNRDTGVRVGALNRTGASMTQFFGTAGRYRAEVVGTGPLGNTTATYEFELLSTNDIRAAFTPSRYAGIAEMEVCFTDNSLGTNLRQWTWNFGNGQTLTYDHLHIPASICTTYTTPAQMYTVELAVTNASGITARATNVVRTYSPLESSATFTITPQSSSRFCYTAVLPGGVTLVGWDFGDGQTGTPQNTICHSYGASGTYVVSMTIEDGSGNTGVVVRTVIVNTGGGGVPTFRVTPLCSADRTATFFVENISAVAMTTPDEVIIRNNAGDIIVMDTLLLGAGQSRTFTVPNQSGRVSFSTVDFMLFAETTCEYPPAISVNAACSSSGSSVIFTISNADGPMITPQNYEVRDSGGAVVTSGSFQLARGAAPVDVTVPNSDPYETYTFSSSGAAGSFNVSHRCGVRPVLTVTSLCSDPITFTISNSGGDMLVPQTFTIVDGSSVDVTPGANSFQLANGASTTVTLTGLDPYAGYTLSTSGFAGATSHTQDCTRPQLVVTSGCSDPLMFTITNNGAPMLSPQGFTIVNTAGQDVTPAPGTFQLAGGGASITITLTGLDPYAGYTLSSSDYAGTLNMTQNCARPALRISGDCTNPVAFTIVNLGGDMLAEQPFTVLNSGGSNVTPAPGTFQLSAGASVLIPLVGQRPEADYVFSSSGYSGTLSLTQACDPGAAAVATPGGTTGAVSGIDGVTVDWASVPVCGRGCPTFRLYHTDETGDWEIFRLDGADQAARTSDRTNLSLGEGAGVDDMAPSLSPNNEWIVFTSNRATEPGGPENWEIYVAPTSGENPAAVQRVTYNHHAIDTDPIWGPNNYVVFETSRNGNWDLYAVDMSTGAEFQLTDSPADDINPFWSSDGSKLVFQSDRDGFWQIYELDLRTMQVTKLSDGTRIDVDPQYAPDDSRIVFRTYLVEDGSSIIALMDVDGRNVTAVTTSDEDATNPAFSPDGALIAYQSDLDGDLDVYVFEVSTMRIRKLTDNDIPDYAPTWLCADQRVVFTSDINGNPDIYEANATPIADPALRVELDADQMTFENFNDIYPQNSPYEENASREGRTALGVWGEQTVFLQPDVRSTEADLSLDGIQREDWQPLEACPPADAVVSGG